jgi:hypothetical protein
MGFFISGVSECPLCGRVLDEQDELFGTWGVFTADWELFPYCDATMHWSCYADWPRREAFAREYFDFWVEEEKTSRCWAKAYLDERVLMTVNPFHGRHSQAILVLARTGMRISVNMAEWERWLECPETSEGRKLYPLVVDELREVVPALKAAIPTRDAVMDALDGESKGWIRKPVGTGKRRGRKRRGWS